jgi:lipopolysaccharide/colanic/teichoic acid biosynthesis glycosyltransferase
MLASHTRSRSGRGTARWSLVRIRQDRVWDAHKLCASTEHALVVFMGNTSYRRWGKRALDSSASFVGLLLVFPVLLVVATLVKSTSPGPILYWQERVGLGGHLFRIAKFRTMLQGADKHGHAITAAGDPRVTAVGRWLRRLKLDELPQLWNVLKGEMSLVGPRPEVPRYVHSYSSAQRRVLSVRPGITDLASIAYWREEELLVLHADFERYYQDVVLPNKLNINLQYLDRMSFVYDLWLLVRTASAIFIPMVPKAS